MKWLTEVSQLELGQAWSAPQCQWVFEAVIMKSHIRNVRTEALAAFARDPDRLNIVNMTVNLEENIFNGSEVSINSDSKQFGG